MYAEVSSDNKIYYTTGVTGDPVIGDSVKSTNFDGTSLTTILDNDTIYNPKSIVLDMANNRAVISDNGSASHCGIYAVNLSTGTPTLVKSSTTYIWGIDIPDVVAPNSGTIVASNATQSTIDLSWSQASDNVTIPKNLQYKVVRSESNDLGDINTIESNGVIVQDWTKNITSAVATGLKDGTNYYFNVIVRDEAGNKSIYTTVSQSTVSISNPEINIKGNSLNIVNGEAMPSSSNYTDFGNVGVVSGTVTRTFTIENIGTGMLTLSGNPRVAITGISAADFIVTQQPSSTIAANNGTTTFNVTFTPSAAGVRTAAISIASDDSDENPYNFNIQGIGVLAAPTSLTATAGNESVLLNWTASEEAASYKIYKGTSSANVTEEVATGIIGTSYTVTGLTNGNTYYFAVKASNADEDSENSNISSEIPVVDLYATITAGQSLGRVVTGKPAYANAKIPFSIDDQSFTKSVTSYSFDVIYDPTKVGTVTVDSLNGLNVLTKPTVGAPTSTADGSKEKVTVSWNGTFTGDLTTLYNTNKGMLFRLNFVVKQTFTSGETPIEVGTGSFTFASGSSTTNITGNDGKIMFGIYGDVNGDGKINSLDGNVINAYINGNTNAITGEAKQLASDANGDGVKGAADDAVEISNYIQKKPSALNTLFGY